MRDPQNIKSIDYNGEKITVIKIENLPDFDMEDWDLSEPKEFNKYILNLKRIIRGSFEYKAMIKYLKDNLNMTSCAFFKNISNEQNYRIKIHVHHEPFALEDICRIVFNKRCYYNESLDENLVAKEVMCLHYKAFIGLIPLSETVHSLVHNSYIFVPLTKVFGNVYEFIQRYEPFMEPEQIDVFKRIEEFTKTYNDKIEELYILNQHYIKVDTSNAYDMPTLEELAKIVSDKIDELHNNDNKETYESKYDSIKNKKPLMDIFVRE